MQLVRDILKLKGGDVHAVAPQTTVYDALRLMAEKEIGALLVMDNGMLRGIFSERDYARKVALSGKTSRDSVVADIMTERVLAIPPACPIDECMQIMTAKKIRHLPVVEADAVVGLISIGDVVKAVIEGKELLIQQLGQYISGDRIAP